MQMNQAGYNGTIQYKELTNSGYFQPTSQHCSIVCGRNAGLFRLHLQILRDDPVTVGLPWEGMQHFVSCPPFPDPQGALRPHETTSSPRLHSRWENLSCSRRKEPLHPSPLPPQGTGSCC